MLQTPVWGVWVREGPKSREAPGAPAFRSCASVPASIPHVLLDLASRNPDALPAVPPYLPDPSSCSEESNLLPALKPLGA